VIGSFQLGPLLLELRGMYSTGNKARDNLATKIRYFQPLDTDGKLLRRWLDPVLRVRDRLLQPGLGHHG